MISTRQLRILLLLLACSLSLIACGTPQETAVSPSPTEATESPSTASPTASDVNYQTDLLVVTTVAPITNIVSNIAGDRVRVVGIIPEGTDSHTFEPRPSDGELLAEANLVFVNGLSLEQPTMELAESVKPQDTKVYELGSNTVTQDQWVFDNSFPQAEGKPNPHLWVSTESAEAYARLAAEQLSQLDPEGADYYAANLEAYLAKLEELDQVTREVVNSIPPENRKLLTYHDSWPYWARQYGFEVIGAIQPSDFNEPSAQEISQLIDQIRASGVPAIFGSEVFPSKVSEQIAREANVKLANTSDDDLPGEGSAVAVENSDPQHTYIGMMADNLRILAENLGGDPSLVDQLDTSNVVGSNAQ
ncbi:zinc ABC transporter substrate-binding protein [filamentous cyanobacterium CCP1]|nr:zinc ABC transporter substrate-binding protein [filamentous cyanobacterium CCP2]PSB68140.1 zinc ABC transporter substrate-binding protein [filamentous cyanobacterium CCP1]